MEIWKDITGYENLYQVSNFGNVKRFTKNGERILKKTVYKNGYCYVSLCKKGVPMKFTIHFLVANEFLNKKNNECVNHKDGNKTNNYVENLEWCSYKRNNNHAQENGLNTANMENSKKVKQSSISGVLIKIHDSITRASIDTNTKRSNIQECLKRNRKTANNFIWSYV